MPAEGDTGGGGGGSSEGRGMIPTLPSAPFPSPTSEFAASVLTSAAPAAAAAAAPQALLTSLNGQIYAIQKNGDINPLREMNAVANATSPHSTTDDERVRESTTSTPKTGPMEGEGPPAVFKAPKKARRRIYPSDEKENAPAVLPKRKKKILKCDPNFEILKPLVINAQLLLTPQTADVLRFYSLR